MRTSCPIELPTCVNVSSSRASVAVPFTWPSGPWCSTGPRSRGANDLQLGHPSCRPYRLRV
jgi:hypothetical protein